MWGCYTPKNLTWAPPKYWKTDPSFWNTSKGPECLFFFTGDIECFVAHSSWISYELPGDPERIGWSCWLKIGIRDPKRKPDHLWITSWWFQIFFLFIPTWGNDPVWLIFFNWVETTNQISFREGFKEGIYLEDPPIQWLTTMVIVGMSPK